MTTQFNYRPDIDGLRALAVLAVIANHLPEQWLASGFLGVDVFFVISGYVVTASTLRQDHTGLGSFYIQFLARRIKRLWPALIACISVTALAVWFAVPNPQHILLTGAASLFGASNFALMHFQLDYFASGARLNAFTHTWSLGVEEQFYVVFPLIVWIFYARSEVPRPKALGLALLTFSAVSLFYFSTLYETNRIAAYFMMPSRFWELGIGALAYLACNGTRGPATLKIAGILSTPALIGLLLTFTIPEDHAAPATVVAVLLTAILVMRPVDVLGLPVLSYRALVYVGRISYSLYLWHWPVVTLAPFFVADAWQHSAFYILVISIAAVISYHTLEKPLRSANWSSSRIKDIALGLCASLLCAVIIYSAKDIRNPSVTNFPPNTRKVISGGAPFSPTCVIKRGQLHYDASTFDQCTVPPAPGSGQPMIWLEGDSHAGHLHSMVHELYESQGLGFHVIETHAMPFPNAEDQKFPPREKIHQEIMRRLQPGDILLISRNYLRQTNPLLPFPDIDEWIERISALAESLESREVAVIVVGPLPRFRFEDQRECLISKKSCLVARAELLSVIDPLMKRLKDLEAKEGNLYIFNIFPHLCPASEEFCSPFLSGHFLYRDYSHLNTLGSAALKEPFHKFLISSDLLHDRSK